MSRMNSPQTTLKLEQQVQRCWRLRPQFAQMNWFEQLVVNEFASDAQLRSQQQHMLNTVLRFAANHVPYYRDQFSTLGLTAEDINRLEDLPKLPILTKDDLQQQGQRLQAPALPAGEQPWGYTTTSGTTGQPVRVLNTRTSNLMFSILSQRHRRIHRWNPAGKLAKILWPVDLPRLSDGAKNPDGATLRRSAWRYAGQFFETGPEVGFNLSNPIDQQLEWLQQQQPQYLITYAGGLEHLAFAHDQRLTPNLASAHVISEQLTPFMRHRIEAVFEIPVEQSYGLNEIGLVAVRCPAGRYHVHIEHCLVEIVDDVGQPCAPGETGHIVVTSLRNLAMPLIRYDTGDLAVALDQGCACGRTLPTFGQIVGRYKRYMHLPDWTYKYWWTILKAFQELPPELFQNLRKYQLHQCVDRRFELRLLTTGPMPQMFRDRLHQAWQTVADDPGVDLSILELDQLPQTGRKHQAFTSDFFPAPDRDTLSQTAGSGID